MKLLTFTQGSDPRPGLALSATVGLDLMAADPTLPGNWHALFTMMERVQQVHDGHIAALGDQEKIRLAGGTLSLPYFDLISFIDDVPL